MSKKYHKEHPTISFRCRNIEEYKKIKQMVKISGKSESTFIREILLNQEIKESQSYNAGIRMGVNKFILPCKNCKKDMVFDITRVEEFRQRIIYMFGNYVCPSCLKKYQQI